MQFRLLILDRIGDVMNVHKQDGKMILIDKLSIKT